MKISKSKYHIIYLLIALSSLGYIIYTSDAGSLWHDEMTRLGNSLLNTKPNTSYITSALLRAYVPIIPYGQRYVYLLPEVFFAGSVYIVGLVGKRLRNGMTGVLACSIMAFSPYLIRQCAHEFGPYYMLLFTSTWMYYLFLKRREDTCEKNIMFMVLYGFSNMMLMDCHEYGKLVAGCYLLLDACLLAGKKLDKAAMVSFLCPIVYLFYWMMHNELGGLWNSYAWTPTPTPTLVVETVKLLLNESYIIMFAFAIGILYILYLLLNDVRSRCSVFEAKLGYYTGVYIVIAVFAASIVYSTFINPDNSLYMERYFVSVVPYMIVIAACGMEYTGSILLGGAFKQQKIVIGTACVLTVVIGGWQTYVQDIDEYNQKYRQSAEYLREHAEVYDEESVVFIPENGPVITAWQWFFTENGKYEYVNTYSKWNFDIKACIYQTIYVIAPIYEPTKEQQEYLDKNYKLEKEINELQMKVYERRE